MYRVMICARPGKEADSEERAGAYVNCYIDYRDARGAKIPAQWYIADMGWLPETVLEICAVDLEEVEPEFEKYIHEAQADGYCTVVHMWPAGADDAHEDDHDDWDPPSEHERRLRGVAGTYVDTESSEQVLRLRTDRHFGWGRDETNYSGTWHVSGDELTLVYFPANEGEKAVLDDSWRVLPNALACPDATLRKEATSA